MPSKVVAVGAAQLHLRQCQADLVQATTSRQTSALHTTMIDAPDASTWLASLRQFCSQVCIEHLGRAYLQRSTCYMTPQWRPVGYQGHHFLSGDWDRATLMP